MWEPPTRLAFTWQIGADRVPEPDPDRASEVEVTLAPANQGTRITVEHRRWERHGSEGERYRRQFAGAWPHALEAFAAYAAARSGP